MSRNDTNKYSFVFPQNNSTRKGINTVSRLVSARPRPLPPVIVRPPLNETVEEGKTVVLECRFMSDTDGYIQWLKHYQVNGSYFGPDNTPYVKRIKVGRL